MKNLTIISILIVLLLAQPALAQYPVFFSSGNFNPPNSWDQWNAIQMTPVANTSIQIAQATAMDNCYFRFFSDLSGGVIYEPNGNADVLFPLATAFPLEVSGGYGKAWYLYSPDLTDNYIFKTDGGGAPENSRAAVFRVQGPVQNISGISRLPSGNVYPGQDVMVSITLSASFSQGQSAYLRWSVTGWSTSVTVEMTGSGTTRTAIIPGSVNTAEQYVNYYVFTSGSGLNIAHNEADLFTFNLLNNNFSNYDYTVQCNNSASANLYFDDVQTDLSHYAPGSLVNFTASFKNTLSSNTLVVRYRHLTDTVSEETFSLNGVTQYTWTWQPPGDDYKGYLVEVILKLGAVVLDRINTAVDVSSGWEYFPRYGFLSSYPYMDAQSVDYTLSKLNRYHINGLQFYDAHYMHHKPLAGTSSDPDSVWNDIANRPTFLETIQQYINGAHNRNMTAMSYNLLYGAFSSTAAADGVQPEWGLYTDNAHQVQWAYNLPAGWASNLQMENPCDTGWQNYLFANESDLFQALNFDGWHVDQLGNTGTVYNYNGAQVEVSSCFMDFLDLAKTALGKRLVMNAVTNYGQQGIAQAPVDFLYTEVWEPYNTFNDLVQVINDNNTYGNGNLPTVLAAYMNRNLSGNPGTFNTPGVLLTEAVIFAAGGSHLELGEHILANEYFPNHNLQAGCDLEWKLKSYYDFLTGYENLLCDSIMSSVVELATTGGFQFSSTAMQGKIWTLSKEKTNTQVFHLINLANANSIEWRDANGTQAEPNELSSLAVNFNTTRQVQRVWVASPDYLGGSPFELTFNQDSSNVLFVIPSLKYWDMVVVDYAQQGVEVEERPVTAVMEVQTQPNPFTGQTQICYLLPEAGAVQIMVYNSFGIQVKSYSTGEQSGSHYYLLDASGLAPGVYYYTISVTIEGKKNFTERRKLVLLDKK